MTSCKLSLLHGTEIVTYAKTVPSWFLLKLKLNGPTYVKQSISKINDYEQLPITLKMEDQRSSDFCIVFTMSLCALELKQALISLLIQIIQPLN